MNQSCFALIPLCLSLVACGGGGSTSSSPPTEAQQISAATTTAQTASECTAIQPFYWEIGNSSNALASGSVGRTTYTSTTVMNTASASKWLYGAYVVEKKAGVLTTGDIKYLNFESGYTSFSICLPGQTVSQCASYASNGVYTPTDDGRFAYGGGHMQQHAVRMNLGALDNAGLAAEMQSVLGADIGMSYSQPQLAGGVVSTAADYAAFLRKLLNGSLRIAAMLGSHPVCTNPLTCTTAISTPIPSDES